MIDLHTHTFFSDGVLLPSELVQRARKIGYKAIAITDHVDISNIDFVIKRIKKVCNDLNRAYKDIICIPGVELTHIPPLYIKKLVNMARKLGAKIVVFHGETVIEPVEKFSNKKAIEAKVDILAHPGKIEKDDVILAKKNKVYLEITARKGHNITNKHVFFMAKKYGAEVLFNTDTHTPENLVSLDQFEKIMKNAGLKDNDILRAKNNAEKLVEKVMGKKIKF